MMRLEMFLETLVYSPFNHPTWLLAREYFVEDMLFIRVARYLIGRVLFVCGIAQVLDSICHVIFLTEHITSEISSVSFLKYEGGELPVPRTCSVQKTR